VVVAPAARGRGQAAVIMDEALVLCGDREVRQDAQTRLTAVYQGYGFVVTGPEFDEDGIRHAPMAREGRPSTL
jgi:ElaA protein